MSCIDLHDHRQAWERLTGRLVGKCVTTEFGTICALCQNDLDWEHCDSCGGEGGHDGYEDDPLWYQPGDIVECGQCNGEGGGHFGHDDTCPNRGLPLKPMPEDQL